MNVVLQGILYWCITSETVSVNVVNSHDDSVLSFTSKSWFCSAYEYTFRLFLLLFFSEIMKQLVIILVRFHSWFVIKIRYDETPHHAAMVSELVDKLSKYLFYVSP